MGEFGGVIRDQTVAAIQKLQRQFTLATAWSSGNLHTDSENFHEHAMYGRSVRQLTGNIKLKVVNEFQDAIVVRIKAVPLPAEAEIIEEGTTMSSAITMARGLLFSIRSTVSASSFASSDSRKRISSSPRTWTLLGWIRFRKTSQ